MVQRSELIQILANCLAKVLIYAVKTRVLWRLIPCHRCSDILLVSQQLGDYNNRSEQVSCGSTGHAEQKVAKVRSFLSTRLGGWASERY